MAKLERVTAKVFASDAPADKIGQFGSALAGTKLETGDVSTIQALPAYTEGWSSAVISQRNYPVLQETNGVMKNMTYQTAYIMQNGIAEYDPDTEYYVGSICKGIGNTNQYASLGDENVGNAVTDSDYWKNITPVNYSNITNCLLEVPQRIKLELNEGVLTLKAGSEVIVPNGFEADGVTPKFDYVTVESDKSVATTGGSGQVMISVQNNDFPQATGIEKCISGSNPTISTYSLIYNTTNNTITRYSSDTTAGAKGSLPIAIGTQTDGVITSIDQVFNGIGYIGSTVWVDKGVKGLIPNGRNEDGSLNNIEVTSDKLYLRTYTTVANNTNINFIFQPNNTEKPIVYAIPSRLVSNWEDINYIKDVDGTIFQGFMYATGDVTNGVITSFNPKQPFRAVDYSEVDGSWVSSLNNIASDVTIANASTLTYDLSSYLPKDSNAYEVYLGIFAKTGNANGNSIEIRIGSSIATIDAGLVCAAQTRAANFITASGIVTIPVGADKIITVKNSGNASGTISLFRAGAYRRLGM